MKEILIKIYVTDEDNFSIVHKILKKIKKIKLSSIETEVIVLDYIKDIKEFKK